MRSQTVGIYRQRVALQDIVEAVDSYGQPVQSWVDLSTFWAEVRFLRGSELLNVKQNWATATHMVKCRWQGAAIAPSPRMRFRLTKDNRIINILSFQNVEERNRAYEFICEEYVQ
jgi:SPP1 family predicted phage head-tail adaptor